MERMSKLFEAAQARTKICEVFVNDKFADSLDRFKKLEARQAIFATTDMIAKIHEDQKNLKMNFHMEFESF